MICACKDPRAVSIFSLNGRVPSWSLSSLFELMTAMEQMVNGTLVGTLMLEERGRLIQHANLGWKTLGANLSH